VRETIAKLLASTSKLLTAILASTKTHKWWWAGGGGAAVVAIAAVVIVFGGFFGPNGKAICTVALEHARDYGVIPSTASLANADAKSTDVSNRRLCTAVADGSDYNLTVDITCKDMKNKDCVALYSVQRADGLSTYQVRQVPDDDTDAAVDVGSQAADTGNAQSAGDGQSAGGAPSAADNNDIQPATGAHGTAPDQQQDMAPQQQ
jgi:hypothetical protein